MIKKQIFFFILRWLVSGVGMWICISLFGDVTGELSFWTYILAGLIFALVNSIVRPLVSILALPFAVFTMGLWSLLISVGMFWLTVKLLPGVSMSFLNVVWSSLIMSVISSLANILLPIYEKK